MVRILVVDSPEGAGRDLSIEQAEFPRPCELARFAWDGDAAALADACRGADAVLTDYVPFSEETLRRMAGCRLISIAATGHDAVDVDAAAAAGISVCCVGEYCTDEVADHTMALILALNRKLFAYHRQVQEQDSWAWDGVTGIRRLAGQTLGLIGLGRIGRAVAGRARAFGLETLAHDPFIDSAQAGEGVRLVDLETLLANADIISLHASLQPGQPPMLNRSTFAKMGRRPVLINVARGGLIDQAALVEALDEKRVAGAGLDVLAEEPPELAGHPLRGRPNVILTPHVAFYSEQALHENRRISARNIRTFLDGRIDQVFRMVHHAPDPQPGSG